MDRQGARAGRIFNFVADICEVRHRFRRVLYRAGRCTRQGIYRVEVDRERHLLQSFDPQLHRLRIENVETATVRENQALRASRETSGTRGDLNAVAAVWS